MPDQSGRFLAQSYIAHQSQLKSFIFKRIPGFDKLYYEDSYFNQAIPGCPNKWNPRWQKEQKARTIEKVK